MADTRTGRFVHLDEHRQVGLNGMGRAEDDTYLVTEAHDGTLVLTPVPSRTADHDALLIRPEMIERLQRDSSEHIEAPADPTPETAAVRLACLALRQAGLWGDPHRPVNVNHPRFAEAVEAAAAAPDRQQALDAATAILQGPEAAAAFGLDPSGGADRQTGALSN